MLTALEKPKLAVVLEAIRFEPTPQLSSREGAEMYVMIELKLCRPLGSAPGPLTDAPQFRLSPEKGRAMH